MGCCAVKSTVLRLHSPLVAMAAVVVLSAGLPAHSNVVSTSPKAGSVVSQMPASMTFKFSDGIIARGTTFTFADRTKMAYPPLKFTEKGTTVRVKLPSGAVPGPVTVFYRVLSADGHPVKGKVEFTLRPVPTN